MELLGKKQLSDFKQNHADARSQIESWEAEVEDAKWQTPRDIKNKYPRASILGDNQVVFDICGNKYRLLVAVAYKTGKVLVKKIGTHKEYDSWKIS